MSHDQSTEEQDRRFREGAGLPPSEAGVQEYRKKPVVIQAIRFTGENADEIGHFAGLDAFKAGREGTLKIKTLEGVMTVSPGDYVIRGVSGEFYPCKAPIFEQTYDPA